MIAFIDKRREVYGVEPICRLLPIAPSTYYEHLARRRDPSRRSFREQRDERLSREIRRIWSENFQVYGARKIWRQLRREGSDVARCTVERLMRRLGFAGAVRGKRIRTTRPDPGAPCPLDRVQRVFHAPRPNALWLSDFTYVATWRGFAYVAFVIDAYARRIAALSRKRRWRLRCRPHTRLARLDLYDHAARSRCARTGALGSSPRR